MKKMKEYRFNDGLDGIVVAKSLKHAVNQLIGFYECYSVQEIIKQCKEWDKDGYNVELNNDWSVDVRRCCKKGIFKKSKILGWCN